MGKLMAISRSLMQKRKATGGRRNHWRKSRKHELGRPPANTQLHHHKSCLRPIRVRGGNIKYRALRLVYGNFAWCSEAIARKTRILNAYATERMKRETLVETKALVKG